MHGPHVLVIDDDEVLGEMIKDLLAEEAYECVVATRGEEGISLAQKLRPALVILDLMLPDVSGYQLCQRLREDPALQRIPVIMLTGRFTDAKDRVQGFESGAWDFFVKPFDARLLVARVKNLIRATYPPGNSQVSSLPQG
ncbi:MAG: response regulator transcription factor [Elusimicrobia bacterium]|nr:response regulator transcription factor [Elusimicrobiota bacterium]